MRYTNSYGAIEMSIITITIESDAPLESDKEIFSILYDEMDNICAKLIDNGREDLAEVLEKYRICLEL